MKGGVPMSNMIIEYNKPGGDWKEVIFTHSFGSFLTNVVGGQIGQLFFDMFMVRNASQVATMLNINEKNDDSVPFNYFHLRKGDEPLISYMPYGKIQNITAEGQWARAGRQTTRPGKWLRTLVKKETLDEYGITDAMVEAFTNRVKEYVTLDLRMEVFSGEDIVRCYFEGNYIPDAGSTLGSSCMRYEYCANYFKLYTRNPNCRLLVAFNHDNHIVGRALVWDNVEAKGMKRHANLGDPQEEFTFTLLDRIYYHEEFMVDVFKDYAKSQGWWHKEKQSYEHKQRLVSPDGDLYTMSLTVPSGAKTKRRYKSYPYVDTFTYMSGDFKTLYNEDIGECYELTHTEGGLRGGPVNRRGYVFTQLDGYVQSRLVANCVCCGQSGNMQNMYQLLANQEQRLCYSCRTLYRYVRTGPGNGGYAPRDACVRVTRNSHYADDEYLTYEMAVQTRNGEYIHPDDALYLAYDNIYVRSNERVVHSTYHNSHIRHADAVHINGVGWVHMNVADEVRATQAEINGMASPDVQDAYQEAIEDSIQHQIDAMRNAATVTFTSTSFPQSVYTRLVTNNGGWWSMVSEQPNEEQAVEVEPQVQIDDVYYDFTILADDDNN
jgi:hypothetical protein